MAAERPPRIATHVWLGALRRRVEAAGGSLTVLRRGDADAGAALLVLRDPAGGVAVHSRAQSGGRAHWQELLRVDDERAPALAESIERQRRFDPDLWVVELDVANPARFIVDAVGID
jgi:hypothetical protein